MSVMLSPPESPNYEIEHPFSGPSNETRRNLNLVEDNSDDEMINIPLRSTPNDLNMVHTDRYGLRSRDSPNFNSRINLVKDTSASHEQNKRFKELNDLDELERGIYNQPKISKSPKSRVGWDPDIIMAKSSNKHNEEPLKPSQDSKMGKRKSFNYPTPSIFYPKISNADQFVSTSIILRIGMKFR